MSENAAELTRKIVIMGAGGRDFHNFNCLFRHRSDTRVLAFTATQIPFQQNRRYPPELAGGLYPQGIPIVTEEALPELLAEGGVEVIFSYSDISHQQLMTVASRVLALGGKFTLPAPDQTMLRSSLPVLSVCAVRTGCGKSPVVRFLCHRLLSRGVHPVVVRHPMAYGDLTGRAVQHISATAETEQEPWTLEEREEFEPLLKLGVEVFCGVDYQAVLDRAEKAGDMIIWDGGNNDTPFFQPDLELVLLDPLRAGDEMAYFPGQVNLRRARILIVSKVDEATPEQMERLRNSIRTFNPNAITVEGRLELLLAHPDRVRNKRVLVVEDGPTVTHGGMPSGAGMVAARRYGAARVVDPRPAARGSLRDTYGLWPHLDAVVPAMGYSPQQLDDLRRTLEDTECDLVLSATPVNLGRLLCLSRPVEQVRYEFVEGQEGQLDRLVFDALGKKINR